VLYLAEQSLCEFSGWLLCSMWQSRNSRVQEFSGYFGFFALCARAECGSPAGSLSSCGRAELWGYSVAQLARVSTSARRTPRFCFSVSSVKRLLFVAVAAFFEL